MLTSKELVEFFKRDQEKHFQFWKEFLCFQSISTKSEHDGDCRACLEWLVGQFKELGFVCERVETEGKPLLLAKRPGEGDGILIYGHYDVQPPEPLELWESPPFEPTIRNGRLYARGAQDNKGQVSYIVAALRTLIDAKALRIPVTLLLEGEEEIGSHGLEKVLPSIKSKIASPTLLVCDTGTPKKSIGAITLGLRGIASLEISVSGPNKDLHSGLHGGAAPNVAVLLAKLAASFHDADGRVTVEGFYDGLEEVDEATKTQVMMMPPSEEEYRSMIGVDAIGGERGLPLPIRVALRPTLEVNGIFSGYTGEGFKTVIPSKGTLKVSLRLVPGQSPRACLDLVTKHVQSFFNPLVNSGLRAWVSLEEEGGYALRMPMDSKLVHLAREIISQDLQLQPLPLWFGASVPIIPALAEAAGALPLMVGFGLEEDSIHAPNESFDLDQFQNGYLFVASLLQRLGQDGV